MSDLVTDEAVDVLYDWLWEPDEYARGSSAAYDGCDDALDALLGGK